MVGPLLGQLGPAPTALEQDTYLSKACPVACGAEANTSHPGLRKCIALCIAGQPISREPPADAQRTAMQARRLHERGGLTCRVAAGRADRERPDQRCAERTSSSSSRAVRQGQVPGLLVPGRG